MKRISHDIPGAAGRIGQLTKLFVLEQAETQQVWKDRKAEAFFKKHTADVEPVVGQLLSAVTQIQELMDKIAKAVRDEESLQEGL